MPIDFPPEMLLTPGSVIRLWMNLKGKSDYKYCFFGCTEVERPVFFLINSNVHKLIEKRPKLMECQVLVPESELDVLQYDSHLNCAQPFFTYLKEEIHQVIESDPTTYLGRLGDDLILKVVEKVEAATVLSPVIKSSVGTALRGVCDNMTS